MPRPRPPARAAAPRRDAADAAAYVHNPPRNAAASILNARWNAAAAAAAAEYPNPKFAGPLSPLDAPPPPPPPPPPPFLAPFDVTPRPPVFPSVTPPHLSVSPGVMPREDFRSPVVRPPPPSPSPDLFGSYPGAPFTPLGPPCFPPPPMPPVGVLSPQWPTENSGFCGAVARPPILPVTRSEKPPFKLFVSKIAPTVDHDFILSILKLCGPVKSWHISGSRNVEPYFGICEFGSAQGILRAMRLLKNLSIDGQELKFTIAEATIEYLEKYDGNTVIEEESKEVKTNEKGMISSAENGDDSSKSFPNEMGRTTGNGGQKCIQVNMKDSDADKDAMQKIRSLIEKRMKSKLPGSQTLAVHPSAGKCDVDGKKIRQNSALEKRKSWKLQEELEGGELSKAGRVVSGFQLLKHKETAASGNYSPQINLTTSMHVSMKGECNVEDKRSQQNASKDFKRAFEEMTSSPGLAEKQNSRAPAEELDPSLIGSWIQTPVPSVFVEGHCYNASEKRKQPLVPTGYFTEEIHAVQGNSSTRPPNFVATAEFAKCNSVSNLTVERPEEQDRSGGRIDNNSTNERGTERDGKHSVLAVSERGKEILDQENNMQGSPKRKEIHDHQEDTQGASKSENKRISDERQLLVTVPKTKEELCAYKVNWEIYDKHGLQERIRPFISQKTAELLYEEMPEVVNYIIACTNKHMEAHQIIEQFGSILEEFTEGFVLSIWRKLIFEIRKVETGLA